MHREHGYGFQKTLPNNRVIKQGQERHTSVVHRQLIDPPQTPCHDAITIVADRTSEVLDDMHHKHY